MCQCHKENNILILPYNYKRFIIGSKDHKSLTEYFKVTKNEPDYRLFLVRILENLGRLDDRPVRENERSTAELHFDQNKKWESYRFGHVPTSKPPSGAEKKTSYKNARAEYIKSDYVKAVGDYLDSERTFKRDRLQGLHNHERLYDEVEDVRTLLDGLGEAIGEKNTRINRHPRSSSYGDPLNRSIRNDFYTFENHKNMSNFLPHFNPYP